MLGALWHNFMSYLYDTSLCNLHEIYLWQISFAARYMWVNVCGLHADKFIFSISYFYIFFLSNRLFSPSLSFLLSISPSLTISFCLLSFYHSLFTSLSNSVFLFPIEIYASFSNCAVFRSSVVRGILLLVSYLWVDTTKAVTVTICSWYIY